jgi:hypothetical protein
MLRQNFNRNILAAAQRTESKKFFIAVEEEDNTTVYAHDETPVFHIQICNGNDSNGNIIFAANLHHYSERNLAHKTQPIASIRANSEKGLGYAINQMVEKEVDKIKPSSASLPVSSLGSADQQPATQPV